MLKLNNYDFKFEKLFKKAPITIEIRLADMNNSQTPPEEKQDAARILSYKYQDLAYAYYVLENFTEARTLFYKSLLDT